MLMRRRAGYLRSAGAALHSAHGEERAAWAPLAHFWALRRLGPAGRVATAPCSLLAKFRWCSSAALPRRGAGHEWSRRHLVEKALPPRRPPSEGLVPVGSKCFQCR